MKIKISDNRVYKCKKGLVRAFFNPVIAPQGIQNFQFPPLAGHIYPCVVYMDRENRGFQNELLDNGTLWKQTPVTAEAAKSQAKDDKQRKTAMFAQYGDDVRFMGVFQYEREEGECLFRTRISDEIKLPEPPMDGLYSFSADAIDDDLISNINGHAELHAAYMAREELACRTQIGDEQIMFRPCCQWNLVLACLATALNERGIDEVKLRDDFYTTDNKKADFLMRNGTIEIATNMNTKRLLPKVKDIMVSYKGQVSLADLRFIVRPADKETDTQKAFDVLCANNKITPCTVMPTSPTQPNGSNGGGKQGYPHNRIIFGAPGTGKSHKANQDANALLLGSREKKRDLTKEEKETKAARMERVTFHPEYSYFDFVGSYKPLMRNVPVMYVDGGILKTAEAEEGGLNTERKIEYDFVPGPFTRILVKALKDQGHPYLLLIEEINRARVAAVFGDIFQLLDRTEEGESEYSICLSEDLKEHLKEQGLPLNELKLPPNLYIWATMNSADQGVYPLDTAFKRRWSMEYLNIDYGQNNDNWNEIRTGINKLLIEKGHVNEDKLMGYHFLKEEERTDAHLEDSLKGKVLMYLFDDAAKPCRKDIFKEINKARIYSDLRAKLSLSEPNLGIFDGAVFCTTTGSDQDSAAPKAEEAEPVDNQQ